MARCGTWRHFFERGADGFVDPPVGSLTDWGAVGAGVAGRTEFGPLGIADSAGL